MLRQLGTTRCGPLLLAVPREGARARRFFALELLRADWAADEELRAPFLEEAAQSLLLEHPNVVATRELLAEPDVCARVTRWFAGQTLQSVLERVGRESFPLYLHLRVSCEVLSALQYLHELPDPSAGRAASCPAVRRQERVLITYTGQVKLLGVGFERTSLEIERRSGRRIAELATAAPESRIDAAEPYSE